MDTTATFKVNFSNGVAEFDFPNAMKHSDCTIACTNMYVPGVKKAKSECLFVTCESSYFRKSNFNKHHNVLATFQLKTANKLYCFPNPLALPLTISPQIIKLQIVNFEDNFKDLPATAVFEVVGKCRDKSLLI